MVELERNYVFGDAGLDKLLRSTPATVVPEELSPIKGTSYCKLYLLKKRETTTQNKYHTYYNEKNKMTKWNLEDGTNKDKEVLKPFQTGLESFIVTKNQADTCRTWNNSEHCKDHITTGEHERAFCTEH